MTARSDKDLDRSQREERESADKRANPGNRSKDREPHHALNNPAQDPDETEWPDPYEKRPDPRNEDDAPAQPSTSEPRRGD